MECLTVTLKRVRGALFIPVILVTAAPVRNFLLWNSFGRFFASWNYEKNLHPLILAPPFIPFSVNINRVEFQLVTPMEDEAGNQYFKLKLWEKYRLSLRHPPGGHQLHFHFSPKQKCMEPNLPHFCIYRPPGTRKELWLCWEEATQDEAVTLHCQEPLSRAGVTGTAPMGQRT